jgi:hypothetical protein
MMILFFAASAWSAYNSNWKIFFSSFVTLIVVLVSKKLHDKKAIEVSLHLYIAFLVFVFLANFLGEINYFYSRFWWWDLFLHANAGILLGLLGFALTFTINAKSENLELNPFFVAFFGFCFSLTLSVFWEFFEFSVDGIFGTNMLKSGLNDTLGDLFVTAIGALLVSTLGYFGLKYKYKRMVAFFKSLVRRV